MKDSGAREKEGAREGEGGARRRKEVTRRVSARGGERRRLPGCVEFLRLKRDFQNNKLRGKWKGKARRGGGGVHAAATSASTIREGFVGGWLGYRPWKE